jgi:hypothetical protein
MVIIEVREAILTKKITDVMANSEKNIGKNVEEIVFEIYVFKIFIIHT